MLFRILGQIVLVTQVVNIIIHRFAADLVITGVMLLQTVFYLTAGQIRGVLQLGDDKFLISIKLMVVRATVDGALHKLRLTHRQITTNRATINAKFAGNLALI